MLRPARSRVKKEAFVYIQFAAPKFFQLRVCWHQCLASHPRHKWYYSGQSMLRAALSAVSAQLGRGDQRIYRALHAPDPHPITLLNNYPHRPRRTHKV